jgi:hypothetical protein
MVGGLVRPVSVWPDQCTPKSINDDHQWYFGQRKYPSSSPLHWINYFLLRNLLDTVTFMIVSSYLELQSFQQEIGDLNLFPQDPENGFVFRIREHMCPINSTLQIFNIFKIMYSL